MHDPMTVAFDIKSPFKDKPSRFWPNGYRRTLVTIWHVDPETDHTDDSCGWFIRARHGDQAIRQKIRREFAHEWDSEYSGWFDAAGVPTMSPQAITLAMFRRAAFVHFQSDWRKTDRFLQRNLLDILWFAENRVDSLDEFISQKYGPSPREERIERAADIIYPFILRLERPWYRHPKWHIWHWKIQIHDVQAFKRWAFSRCAGCGQRFTFGYSPVTFQWNSDGPSWFRGERGIYHADCMPKVEAKPSTTA